MCINILTSYIQIPTIYLMVNVLYIYITGCHYMDVIHVSMITQINTMLMGLE